MLLVFFFIWLCHCCPQSAIRNIRSFYLRSCDEVPPKNNKQVETSLVASFSLDAARLTRTNLCNWVFKMETQRQSTRTEPLAQKQLHYLDV